MRWLINWFTPRFVEISGEYGEQMALHAPLLHQLTATTRPGATPGPAAKVAGWRRWRDQQGRVDGPSLLEQTGSKRNDKLR
jgi:hypothetical protein